MTGIGNGAFHVVGDQQSDDRLVDTREKSAITFSSLRPPAFEQADERLIAANPERSWKEAPNIVSEPGALSRARRIGAPPRGAGLTWMANFARAVGLARSAVRMA